MTHGKASGAHGPGGGAAARERDNTLGMRFGIGFGMDVGIAFGLKPGACCRAIATITPGVNTRETKKPAGLETYGGGKHSHHREGAV